MISEKMKRTVVGFVAALCCLCLVQTTAFAQEDVAAAEEETGVVIVAVQPASAAATAGLRRGDIILRLNAIELDNAEELAAVVHAAGAEATVTLDILHGDDERQLEITLGERNGQAFLGVTPYRAQAVTQATAQFGPPMPAWPAMPGMPAMPPVPPVGHQGEEVSFQVTEILPDSPAAVAGLQVGQQIVGVNGQAFGMNQGLVEVVRSHEPGDVLTLTVAAALTDTQAVTATQVVTVALAAAPDDESAAYLGIRMAPMVTIMAREVQARPSTPGVQRFHHGFAEPLPTSPWCQCGMAQSVQPQHFFFQQLPMSEDVASAAGQAAVTISRLAVPATPADARSFGPAAPQVLPALPHMAAPTEEYQEFQIEILDDQI